VGWIVERLAELWPHELRWLQDDGHHPHEARYLKLDSSRARAHLGWRPPVTLESGLEQTVSWYAQLGAGADMQTVTRAQIDDLTASH
jgi:CDP-glucose 4,6-dehydratase